VRTETFNPLVRIDCREIRDDASLHDKFAAVFGFPVFYGRNWNAWIDCMTSLDEEPTHAMSRFNVPAGGVLTLHLDYFSQMQLSAASTCKELIGCAAFVNYRRVTSGEPPILALSYSEGDPP
jgi:hypothetical protein